MKKIIAFTLIMALCSPMFAQRGGREKGATNKSHKEKKEKSSSGRRGRPSKK